MIFFSLVQVLCEVKQRALEELQLQEQSSGKMLRIIHNYSTAAADGLVKEEHHKTCSTNLIYGFFCI